MAVGANFQAVFTVDDIVQSLTNLQVGEGALHGVGSDVVGVGGQVAVQLHVLVVLDIVIGGGIEEDVQVSFAGLHHDGTGVAFGNDLEDQLLVLGSIVGIPVAFVLGQHSAVATSHI